jgi:fructose-specific phosphotransferase system IIC component
MNFISGSCDILLVAIVAKWIEMSEPFAQDSPLAVVTLSMLGSVVSALASALLAGSPIYDPSTVASSFHLIDLPQVTKKCRQVLAVWY